jgi:hypothetical protein
VFPRLELAFINPPLSFPWITGAYTVFILVLCPGDYSLLALAQALIAHVQRVKLPVIDLAYATSSSGAVAAVVYDETFEDSYLAMKAQAELNPEWYNRSHGPVLGFPEYDLAIRTEANVERLYNAVMCVNHKNKL